MVQFQDADLKMDCAPTFDEIAIRGLTLRPARFCAPLAEITHSAFRRLLMDFGGCGAHFTEMLSGRQLLVEDMNSPSVRRNPGEARLIYQLMIRPSDPVERIIGRIAGADPDGIDLNLACYAPLIRQREAGGSLFENSPGLAAVLQTIRRCWPGPLTVKIRLGSSGEGTRERFIERLRIIDDCGVDALTLHTRFFEDKFKRRARHELFAWAASLTRLPIIANGDITGPQTIRDNPAHFRPVAGIMIGRMAVARPWIFAAWDRPLQPDLGEVWRRHFDYICEDFPPAIAVKRLRLFTRYYARNFLFGHAFNTAIQNAATPDAMRERADAFFATAPALVSEPSLMGI